jgi:hypothetical protein
MKNLLETVNAMCSEDYRERMRAEYQQTKIRYERLKNFCDRIEAAEIVNNKEIMIEPKHDCPLWLLREQQRVMGEYLHFLELRAEIEAVELEVENR